LRDADRLRRPRARRGNVRDQVQENLRAHADTNSTQTPEEEIDGGEVADAETKRNAGEIGFAEEKSGCESDSIGDAISKRVCFSEKEKIITEPHTGILTDRFEQEEETQEFSHSVSFARRIAFAIGKPERDA
jgi:hypothetical protein